MSNDVKEVEIEIEQAKRMVGLRDALIRLEQNKDFVSLFIDGYINGESTRLVLLKADHNMRSAENQEAIEAELSAISRFNQYMRTTIVMGNMAEDSLTDMEDTRQELLVEE